jgi:hypothetical protein
MPKYRAKVANNGVYQSWSDAERDLEESFPEHEFMSKVHFNEKNAKLELSLTYDDVQIYIEHFASTSGDVIMEFRISAFIPGSEAASASMPDSDLINFTIYVVLVDQSTVGQCMDTQLINTRETIEGGIGNRESEDHAIYQVPTMDEGDNVLVLENFKIKSSIDDCPLVTIPEIKDFHSDRWNEIRNDEYHTVFYNDG